MEDLNRHYSQEDIQITYKHKERCLTLLIITEMKIKTTMRYYLIPSEWSSSKNPQIIIAGEGVEKREPKCTVGGNVNWYNHYGEQYRGSLKKLKLELSWPSNPTKVHIPWENCNSKRLMYSNVYCSSNVYNSQEMEAT